MSREVSLTFSISNDLLDEGTFGRLFSRVKDLGFSAVGPSGQIQAMDVTGEGSLMFRSEPAAAKWLATDGGLVVWWLDEEVIDVSVEHLATTRRVAITVSISKRTLTLVRGVADALPRWAHDTARALGASGVVGETDDAFGLVAQAIDPALVVLNTDAASCESAWLAGRAQDRSEPARRVELDRLVAKFVNDDFLTIQTDEVPWAFDGIE